jgi:tRNA nucleotidyltransferase/poly(A) polymerase
MIQLPEQLWDLRAAFRAQGFDMRLVGGTVRDALLNLTPKDVDLHTDATPDECIQIYNATGVRWEPTGIDHGTITVVFDHVGYEITSLRKDVETDGRRATVIYTRDWVTDLARRDFTMNAMSMSFEGDLLDPFQGEADLLAGRVTFVGDAETRIREDYLRILRWFRFRGRFGNQDTQADLIAVINHASGLKQISRERVWSEIKQILSKPSGAAQMCDMHAMGVASWINLPKHMALSVPSHLGTNQTVQHAHNMSKQGAHAITVLVCLYGYQCLPVLSNWKASSDEQALAQFLCKNQEENPFRCMAVDGVSRAWARELALLQDKDAFELAVLDEWQVPVFPVTGYDLIQLGMVPGPDFGRIMAHLKDVWAATGYMMNKAQLLHLVKMDLESHM